MRLSGLLIGALVLGTACGSDSTGASEAPSISLALSRSSASLSPGGSVLVTATVTRHGGYAGEVTFSVTGVPTGVTATISSILSTGNLTTAIVTLSAAAAAPAGNASLVVHATGSGVAESTAGFALTVGT